jgi:hypothetical protein
MSRWFSGKPSNWSRPTLSAFHRPNPAQAGLAIRKHSRRSAAVVARDVGVVAGTCPEPHGNTPCLVKRHHSVCVSGTNRTSLFSSHVDDTKLKSAFSEVSRSRMPTVGMPSFWIWAFGYLYQVVWTNPLGKCGLNLLRLKLNVHTCCQDRFVHRKFVCRARDQTFRDASNTGF